MYCYVNGGICTLTFKIFSSHLYGTYKMFHLLNITIRLDWFLHFLVTCFLQTGCLKIFSSHERFLYGCNFKDGQTLRITHFNVFECFVKSIEKAKSNKVFQQLNFSVSNSFSTDECLKTFYI
jgi:hypothetical protein